jgi:DNA-directed RNA polymerase subunit RPC12/RpoP
MRRSASSYVTDRNRLSIICPLLALKWDYLKNSPLTPNDVSYSSHKKYFWKCQDCGESYDDSINHQYRGRGCPYCSGRRVNHKNSLFALFNNVALQWDYTKNGSFSPHDLTAHSNKEFWWLCENGHSWFCSISARTAKNNPGNCPYCLNQLICIDNCLFTLDPDLCREWNYKRNIDITPYDVGLKSETRVWWICQFGHEWEAIISSRSMLRRGCPHCNGIILIDGTTCGSLTEAYYYLQYKLNNDTFSHNKPYGGGLGRKRYDFYLEIKKLFG